MRLGQLGGLLLDQPPLSEDVARPALEQVGRREPGEDRGGDEEDVEGRSPSRPGRHDDDVADQVRAGRHERKHEPQPDDDEREDRDQQEGRRGVAVGRPGRLR